MSPLDTLIASNKIPDWLIRIGIRVMLAGKIREEKKPTAESEKGALLDHVRQLKGSPIAVQTTAANDQHYEVPTQFFKYCLGPRLKYSSGYWPIGVTTLAQAEEEMLALTCRRAELHDGLRILELGCGWGSLSLWMAEKYPNARITGVSNSATQKQHIDEQARQRGLKNLTIITADMNVFAPPEPGTYDRVVSVEMFEHMKNYQLLLARIAAWLKDEGKLFVHIFTHKTYAYHFLDRGPSDWMTRYFFAGGQMPSDDLLLYFQDDLKIEDHWKVDGTHYQKTAEAWLVNMDAHREEIEPLFAETYGPDQVTRWWCYWRVFYLACAELWGYRNGREWGVSHYRFRKD